MDTNKSELSSINIVPKNLYKNIKLYFSSKNITLSHLNPISLAWNSSLHSVKCQMCSAIKLKDEKIIFK